MGIFGDIFKGVGEIVSSVIDGVEKFGYCCVLLQSISNVAKITHKSKSNRSWQRKRRCWARKLK